MTGGSFIISSDKLHEFHKKMVKYIFEKKPLHMTETHNGLEFSPVIVDIDLDFDIDSGTERKITEAQIKAIYIALVKRMWKHFDDPESVKFHCYITVKPAPYRDTEKNRIRDGIHYIFPNISTTGKYQEFLRNDALPSIDKILKEVGNTNSTEMVYDKGVAKAQFTMYMNHKEGQGPYSLEYIYCYDASTKKIKDLLPAFKQKYSDPKQQTLHLLETLSLRNKNAGTVNIKTGIITSDTVATEKKKTSANVDTSGLKDLNIDNFEMKEVTGLLKLLNPKRAEDYQDWIKLGWCLHNINSEEALAHWIQFSKQSKKFKDGECEKYWNTARDEGYNIWSLRKWASEDSPDKYKEFFQNNTNYVITQSSSGTHNDVAHLMYQLYKEEYVCTVNSKGAPVWFVFYNHRWHVVKKGLKLRQKISTDLVKVYYSEIEKLREQATKMNPETEADRKKEIEKKYMGLYKICRSLKDSTFKSRVMKECTEYFQKEKFIELLDSNTNLLGFENGVYDCRTMEFRPGQPQDYISMSTGYNYDSSAQNKELVTFLKSVMPIKEDRDYLLKLLSLTLFGYNFEQIFPLLSGVGSNGKSSLLDLLRRVLGDYFAVLPVSALTGKRADSNACTPELANLKGKRCAVMNEPQKGLSMNLGKMKEWTGRDYIQARALYSDPVEFMMTCIFFLVCNDLPEIDAMDGGTWRRLRNIHFPSRFVEEPNPKEKFEFKVDTRLPEKFETWAPAFCNILITYFQQYKKEGLKTPPSVIKFTEQYKVESDFMQEFVGQHLCPAKEGDFVAFKDINIAFLSWFRENYPSKKNPASKELKKFLKANYFRREESTHRRRQGWFGFRLVNVDSDSEIPDDLEPQ